MAKGRRPLRILQITPYFEQAWAYGGIPRVASSLSYALCRRGHRVTVCTTDVRCAATRLTKTGPVASLGSVENNPLDLRIFRNVSNHLAYHQQFFMPRGLRRYLRQHARSFDLAHIHAHHHLLGVIAARELKRVRVPYVVTPNGTAGRIERRRFAKWVFDSTLGRTVLPNASRLLAVSRAEEVELMNLGTAEHRIRRVANPVDLSEFSPATEPGQFRQRLGIKAQRIILYLGKLTPRKGVDVLVRAFALLNDSDSVLVIAGNDMGSQKQIVALIKRMKLENRVRLTGLLSGRKRLEALSDATVVAYAGKNEIFGLVPLEANMCGTPVVVADDSGCGENQRYLGGGLVVPYGDVSALADAIRSILDHDAQWQHAVQGARVKISSELGADTIAARLEAIYSELVP
jgi:glycosyltransferase involved in cell wall biosynthesis